MTEFYRTRINFAVLSDAPIPENYDLPDIMLAADSGDMVAGPHSQDTVQITGKEMADALHTAGSTPDFFGLDDEGEELDE